MSSPPNAPLSDLSDPSASQGVPRPRPQSLADLFMAFTVLALQGFGGVLAVVQREMVERKRWFSRQEFLEEWSVAQVMPGPNVVNLAVVIGDRFFGLRGAAVAVAGLLTVPLLVVLALAMLYAQFADNPQVASALRGMGAVAAGLITATGLKLSSALKNHPIGVPMCAFLAASAFVAVALLRVPLVWVLLGLGGTACLLTWRKLSP